MITLDDYWMGRDKQYPLDLNETIRANAKATVDKANLLLATFKQATGDTIQRKVTSGWRPPRVNAATPGAAVMSNHMTGNAIDLYDPEGSLDDWLTDEILEKLDLYREHPSATKNWCHVQIVPPKSKRRTFYP
jgi:hypothetical protein